MARRSSGLGPAGLVALGAAIYEPRIARVAMIGTLASFKSDVPYVNQRMGILAPRILRDAGDVPHLASLVAPRKLMVSGAVTGGCEVLPATALGEQFAYTKNVYRLLGVEGHLTMAPAELTSKPWFAGWRVSAAGWGHDILSR